MSEGEKQESETVPPPPPVQDNPRIVEHFERSRQPGEDDLRRKDSNSGQE